jgi:hypothetical protein
VIYDGKILTEVTFRIIKIGESRFWQGESVLYIIEAYQPKVYQQMKAAANTASASFYRKMLVWLFINGINFSIPLFRFFQPFRFLSVIKLKKIIQPAA